MIGDPRDPKRKGTIHVDGQLAYEGPISNLLVAQFTASVPAAVLRIVSTSEEPKLETEVVTELSKPESTTPTKPTLRVVK